MAAEGTKATPLRMRRHPAQAAAGQAEGAADTAARRMARSMGLLDGPKAKHVNAKAPPRLFQAAAIMGEASHADSGRPSLNAAALAAA